MLNGLIRAHKGRRTRFEDLRLDTTWQRKADGRCWQWYWDGDRKRTIYRYQWVWITSCGPIPRGYHIHHKNFRCDDDRIENLALMTRKEHFALHGKAHSEQAAQYVCKTCGVLVRGKSRGSKRPKRQYCSKAHWYKALRGTVRARVQS